MRDADGTENSKHQKCHTSQLINATVHSWHDAAKLEIKEAVEKLFGKKVESVRTANYNGKKKRERRADFGRTKNWKKAFVKLADGEAIEFV